MDRLRQKASMHVFAWLVMLLMLTTATQVVCSALDINPIWNFSTPLPFLGRAVTLNSLLDFEWHLLVVMSLLPAGLVWLANSHVRVDFLYESVSNWSKRIINILGNLIFALPFFVLMLPASWNFMLRAWKTNEGSRNDGLNDLWAIKAILPLGIALLALAILIETIRLIRGRDE